MRLIQLNGLSIAVIIFVINFNCFHTKFSNEDGEPRRIYWAPITKRNASNYEQIAEPLKNMSELKSREKGEEVDMETMINKLFEMADKNYTFHVYVGGDYITSLEELLKHPGHKEAIKEAYHQIKLVEGQEDPENDFPLEDFDPESFSNNNHTKYTEENTDRPGDSSRIVSRNSPQPKEVHDITTNIQQKRISNDATNLCYNYIVCLLLTFANVLKNRVNLRAT